MCLRVLCTCVCLTVCLSASACLCLSGCLSSVSGECRISTRDCVSERTLVPANLRSLCSTHGLSSTRMALTTSERTLVPADLRSGAELFDLTPAKGTERISPLQSWHRRPGVAAGAFLCVSVRFDAQILRPAVVASALQGHRAADHRRSSNSRLWSSSNCRSFWWGGAPVALQDDLPQPLEHCHLVEPLLGLDVRLVLRDVQHTATAAVTLAVVLREAGGCCVLFSVHGAAVATERFCVSPGVSSTCGPWAGGPAG